MNLRSVISIFYKTAVVALLLLFSLGGYAQQVPQFTQYMFSGQYYNPALAGRSGITEFSAFHRSQWEGYRTNSGAGGAPVTQLIAFQGRANNQKIGYGLTVVNDQIGATSNLELNVQGSYHKKIQRTQFSFGGYLGVSTSKLDFEELQLVNPEPNLPQTGTETQFALDMGAGMMLDRGKFYLGLSGRHLNQPSYDFGTGSYGNRLQLHSYALLGYRFRPVGQVKIEPSILVKSLGAHTISYETSVIATIQNKLHGGIGYRGEESISMILGYSLLKEANLKLGYAFDLVVGGRAAKSPTSHEFMLRYTLSDVSRTVSRVIQRTPRFRF